MPSEQSGSTLKHSTVVEATQVQDDCMNVFCGVDVDVLFTLRYMQQQVSWSARTQQHMRSANCRKEHVVVLVQTMTLAPIICMSA
jgi:hypothetical protein